RNVAATSYRLFSQTEASRSYLESLAPAAAGKTHLMRPMIPSTQSVPQNLSSDGPLELVYAGKLAKDWKTLEMLEIPRALKTKGIDANLTVVGSKINKDSLDPSWAQRMKSALEEANEDPESGVNWLGALTRSETLEVISRSDIGIGWRTQSLD